MLSKINSRGQVYTGITFILKRKGYRERDED